MLLAPIKREVCVRVVGLESFRTLLTAHLQLIEIEVIKIYNMSWTSTLKGVQIVMNRPRVSGVSEYTYSAWYRKLQ